MTTQKTLSLFIRKNYTAPMFFIGALIIALFSSMLYREYKSTQHAYDAALTRYEILREQRLVYLNLINMETAVRGYFLTQDESYLKPYLDSKDRVPLRISNLKKLIPPQNPESANVDVFVHLAEQSAGLLDNQVEDFRLHRALFNVNLAVKDHRAAMDEFRQAGDKVLTEGYVDLKELERNSTSKSQRFVYVLIGGTTIALLILLLAYATIRKLSSRHQKHLAQLRSSEERLLRIIDGINEGVFDYNVQNSSVYFSPEYKKMLGYDSDAEMSSQHADAASVFKDYVHPEDFEEAFKTFDDYAQRARSTYVNVFRMRHKNGRWRWLLARGVGEWNEQGHMIRLIGAVTDITDQKRKEEDLAVINKDMESFLYIASHDLRAPLVNLKGFAGEIELALKQIRLLLSEAREHLTPQKVQQLDVSFEEDLPQFILHIRKAVEKMDSLTTAILDLSRIGKKALHIEEVDMNALVKKTVESLNFYISKKGVNITIGDLPALQNDKGALEHIFFNLIENAVKYLSPERQGLIKISARHVADDVIFIIKDNGRGIAPEDRARIFEIFRRARNVNDTQGLGMGMSYVKATVRKLGGRIWFESAFNEGTTFFVRLPLRLELSKVA